MVFSKTFYFLFYFFQNIYFLILSLSYFQTIFMIFKFNFSFYDTRFFYFSIFIFITFFLLNSCMFFLLMQQLILIHLLLNQLFFHFLLSVTAFLIHNLKYQIMLQHDLQCLCKCLSFLCIL